LIAFVCVHLNLRSAGLRSGSTPILIASVKVRNTAYRRRREVCCKLLPLYILSSIKKGCTASSLHPAISHLGNAVNVHSARLQKGELRFRTPIVIQRVQEPVFGTRRDDGGARHPVQGRACVRSDEAMCHVPSLCDVTLAYTQVNM
jgi:hypothetical protein